MNIDLASPFTAILSISVAAFSGFSFVVGSLHEPTVTGSAVYSEPVRAGETVNLVWTFQKRGECAGENSRVWDGADGFHVTEAAKRNSLPETDEPIHPVIPTRIPELAPPGELVMTVVGECLRGNTREAWTLGPVIFNVVE